jgi:diadenosine tetraphosphate (Ap4A) HIT family hydrolase
VAEACLACQINAGEVDVPGGVIAETLSWRADHCLGPFGVGAVVVKTKTHLEDFWRLPDQEARELGPFLRDLSDAIIKTLGAERIYLTMWVDSPPHHVHLVLYPRYPADDKRALDLQFHRRVEGPPPPKKAADAAAAIRAYLATVGDA